MAEHRKSQAQFMEEVHTPPQEESNVKNGVDEFAFTMTELIKTMAKMPKEEASVNIQALERRDDSKGYFLYSTWI